MMRSYLTFDFGKSFFRDQSVVSLMISKMPVSISLGLWTTLLVYLISIPLGIRQGGARRLAVRRLDQFRGDHGQRHPRLSVCHPADRAVRRRQLLDWFPLRGLVSENWAESGLAGPHRDYFWHITLPVLSMVIGGFAGLTMLTKNSFLEEINKQYVVTARSKGLDRAPGALRPCLPQRHADRHRRFPERFRRRALHRIAAHRDHLLPGRHGTARLRGGHEPGLSGDVRHPVYLYPAGAAAQPGR